MTSSPATSPQKQGILSFFQNPKKASNTTQSTESTDLARSITEECEKEPQSTELTGTADMETQVIEEIDESENEKDLETDGVKNESKGVGKETITREISPSSMLSSDTQTVPLDKVTGDPDIFEQDKASRAKSGDDTKSDSDNEQPDVYTTAKQEKRDLIRMEKEKAKKLRELKKQEEKRQRELKREKEKQQRELRKLEEKARKEKEKKERETKREEEKRQRELKKEQEKLQREQRKEEEKRKKEEEKRVQEDEKRKKEQAKERAQSRIGNFFRKASTPKSELLVRSDYEKYFLPFYVKDGVKLFNNFKLPDDILEKRHKNIHDTLALSRTHDTVEWIRSKRVARGYEVEHTAVQLLQQMTSKDKTDEQLQELLELIPHKYIKFYENVRPPYVGTYSKSSILPKDDPFSTEGTGLNYGYDSDLDWANEEDEDGGGVEDLEDGDEEDEDEEEQDDGSEGEFDEFLDKEDPSDGNVSRGVKKFIGPLIPTIIIRGEESKLDEEDRTYFRLLSAEYLIEEQPFPVDPMYIPPSNKRVAEESSCDPGPTAVSLVPSSGPSIRKKAKTLITDSKDLLKLFEEVHESTFSLGTISEITQKHLPQYSKETIKNTVKEYASRASGKSASRKWEVKDLAKWEQMKYHD